jgi:hypothetical protein
MPAGAMSANDANDANDVWPRTPPRTQGQV